MLYEVITGLELEHAVGIIAMDFEDDFFKPSSFGRAFAHELYFIAVRFGPAGVHAVYRITSYNVCYTKLLRLAANPSTLRRITRPLCRPLFVFITLTRKYSQVRLQRKDTRNKKVGAQTDMQYS